MPQKEDIFYDYCDYGLKPDTIGIKYYWFKKVRYMRSLVILLLTLTLTSGQVMAVNNKLTYGYIEKAVLVEKDLLLTAKMDTGAKSASLSAIKITPIEKNGKTLLQFIVPSKRGDIPFEAEYVGTVKIKVRAQEKKSSPTKIAPIRRPVVIMRIKIGNKQRDILVNLTNRKRFNYPLLLGRDAIKLFDGMIDPSLKFTIKTPSGKQ